MMGEWVGCRSAHSRSAISAWRTASCFLQVRSAVAAVSSACTSPFAGAAGVVGVSSAVVPGGAVPAGQLVENVECCHVALRHCGRDGLAAALVRGEQTVVALVGEHPAVQFLTRTRGSRAVADGQNQRVVDGGGQGLDLV